MPKVTKKSGAKKKEIMKKIVKGAKKVLRAPTKMIW